MILKEVLAEGVELYCGDCREILPTIPAVDVVLTDPVWPNCPPDLLQGSGDPDGLFQSACEALPIARQLVVCLRTDCDVRMLRHVPRDKKFQQVMWLPFVVPGYAGRVLTNEIAYVFGQPIPFEKGRQVIPSQAPKVQPWDRPFQRGEDGHPCPRSVEHMAWLLDWVSLVGGIVLDPFMGSGTTGIAAVKLGRKFIGIEIEERYFDLSCRRISDAMRQGDMFIRQTPVPGKQEVML